MGKEQSEIKTVPPRNDPNPLEPYAKSKALEARGLNPDFEYQWFLPAELAKKLVPHEIGDQWTGYLMVGPWEVVDNKQGVTTGRARDDAGQATDTVMTNGELIFCRIHKSEYAKYGVIERKRDEIVEKRLAGERHDFGGGTGMGGTTFKTRTAGGRAGLGADPSNITQGL